MLEWMNMLRADWLVATSQFNKALDDMPARVHDYWRLHADEEFEGIPRDAFFYARASEGLMAFFTCVAQAEGKPCALPSKAADSVWHAWLAADPRGLDRFTLKHFKRLIPHVEAREMASDMGAALGRSLVISRMLDRKRPEWTGVSDLFALDRKLRMPHGYGYHARDGAIGYGLLDARGRSGAILRFPPALAAAGLLAAGLITQEQYENALARKDGEGCSCGGSGCGSGCGGGCGGC